MQQRTVTRLTGSEIAAHNAAAEPLNIVCIEDGAGFLAGHFYTIGEDGIIVDVFATHDHTSTATGGSLYEIKRANYKNMIEMDMSLNIFAAAFWKSVVGAGGTLTENVDTTAATKYVILTTDIANNDVVNGEAGGGRLTFGKPITLQLKYGISTNASVAYRMGCGQSRMETQSVTSQLGFEGCTSTNTLNRVFSADTITWSGENMSDMVNTVPLGLRLDYYPSSKIVATDGEGNLVTKLNNLPLIGNATNSSGTFRIGIKTMTTAARNLKLYGMRLVGDSHDSLSGVKGWL